MPNACWSSVPRFVERATLDERIRELPICRVGHLLGATYEVYRHEEITTDVEVKDSTFDELRPRFSEQEILELTVTCPYYNMICRVLVALHIEAPQAVAVQ